MGIIYRITNLINGKQYIGKTINTITERWNKHCYEAFTPQNKGYNFLIHKAIRKYGKDNFIIEEIYSCEDSELNEKEQDFIQKYNTLLPNGYNMTLGGEGSIKISREKIYKLWDNGLSSAAIKKELNISSNTVLLVLNQYENYNSEENNKRIIKSRQKTVYQYSKDKSILLHIYESIKDAAKMMGDKNPTLITKCCHQKKPSAYGFYWSFTKIHT